MVTTLSSREFNQDTGKAKSATSQGPVIITDRGKPSHVLLSIEEYRRLTGRTTSLIEALGSPPGIADIDITFEMPRDMPRAADFD